MGYLIPKMNEGMLIWNRCLGRLFNNVQDHEMNESAHAIISDNLMDEGSAPVIGEMSGEAIDAGQSFIGCIH